MQLRNQTISILRLEKISSRIVMRWFPKVSVTCKINPSLFEGWRLQAAEWGWHEDSSGMKVKSKWYWYHRHKVINFLQNHLSKGSSRSVYCHHIIMKRHPHILVKIISLTDSRKPSKQSLPAFWLIKLLRRNSEQKLFQEDFRRDFDLNGAYRGDNTGKKSQFYLISFCICQLVLNHCTIKAV